MIFFDFTTEVIDPIFQLLLTLKKRKSTSWSQTQNPRNGISNTGFLWEKSIKICSLSKQTYQEDNLEKDSQFRNISVDEDHVH